MCSSTIFYDIIATHLKEEVDKVWVLLQFGTDYTKELYLFIFCRSSQHLPTQTNQFLTEQFHSHKEKNVTKLQICCTRQHAVLQPTCYAQLCTTQLWGKESQKHTDIRTLTRLTCTGLWTLMCGSRG